MLTELAVTNLGVIDELAVVLGPGLTALTGETGAGKTMLVESIELLVGGRADPILVRPGSDEATVEGRFVMGDDEIVLTRIVPRDGRSRAYINGRLAPAAALADSGAELLDLHGQHGHQSLLSAASQRAALDAFAGSGVDLASLREARQHLGDIDEALARLGGDARVRAREIDLLRFQVAELQAAGLADPDEDDLLEREEDALADASAHRDAATRATAALVGDGGAGDGVAAALGAVGGRGPFETHAERLRSLAAELADVGAELRAAGEAIADDPERLAAVRDRRQRLRELQRKYGDTLADVIAFGAEASDRLDRLESHDEDAARLEAEREAALERVAAAAARVGGARRAAAPRLAQAVQAHLVELAMRGARVAVEVGDDDPGDDVRFLLAANRGAPLLPMAKVASGGELARAMLALRLVLLDGGVRRSSDVGTLVFDEVDAGIGGRAALAVGRALAMLASDRQVLVVTHLPQVAAFADRQLAIVKREDGAGVTAGASDLDADARVIELSRMLSGSPESTTAQEHAAELLAVAARERGREA